MKKIFYLAGVAIFIIGSFFVIAPSAFAATTTSAPTVAENVDVITNTGISWSPANDALAVDGTVAQTGAIATTGSKYLKLTGFNFSAIPSDAIIVGIEVSVTRQSTSGLITDNSVILIGSGSSTNKASSSAWPTDLTATTYGGESDLWGTTWTQAQINNAAFGLEISVKNTDTSTHRASIDGATITVYYTPAATSADVSTIEELNAALINANISTINVAAGTYEGNFTIDRNLTLTGVGSGDDPLSDTIINGAIDATGSNVTIQNLKITNQNDPTFFWGVRASANNTLTLNSVTIDVLYYGVHMRETNSNTAIININNCNIKGYGAIVINSYSGGIVNNNTHINVAGTTLTGTTKHSGTQDDFGVISLESTTNAHIDFTGSNTVANEYTDNAQSKERLVSFTSNYSASSGNSITGTPTYTNAANSEVNAEALFMSYGTLNTVEGQVVARWVTNTAEFAAALSSAATTPIVVARYSTIDPDPDMPILPDGNTLSAGVKLLIEENNTVTIATEKTLTNTGTIIIEPNVTFTNSGTINGNGSINLCVNTVGTNGCFSSIQSAITAAPSGATINVAAGTYSGEITVSKSLTINGANSGKTGNDETRGPESIIDGGGTSTGGLVKITASSGTVTISGFTIQNTEDSDDHGHGVYVDNAGVNVKILNNAIKNVGPVGINIHAADSIQIEGNIISALYSAVTPHVIPNGIQIWNGSWDNMSMGITGTITDNEIRDSYWIDVSVATGDYETGNEGGAGILIMDTTADLEISNNDIHNNDVGIDIEAGSLTTIENNDIHDNVYGVVLWNQNPSINNNKIVNNRTGGVYEAADGTFLDSEIVDATNNWWGATSGPYHSTNPTGLGNAVSDNVTFDPYYINHDPMTTTNEDVVALATAKTTAHSVLTDALATYTEENYSETNWITLTGFKTDGDTAIDAAGTTGTVTTAQNTATDGMAGVETIAETNTAALVAAKTTAHSALTSALATYTEGNYSGANWITLTGFKTTGDTAIDAAGTTGAVTSAQNTATAGMAGVETITIATALAEAKSAEAALTSTDYVSYTAVTAALALPETTNAEKITKTSTLNGAVSGLVRVDTLFDSISSTLVAAGIANNMNAITGQTWTSFSGAYFEKSVSGIKRGKITFSSALDFSNSDTRDFLQALGNKMDMADAGTIGLDFRGTTDSVSLKGVSATIEFYGLDSLGFTTSSTSDDVNSKLVAYDDNGNVLNKSDLVSTPGTYTPPVGACEVGGACYIFAVNVNHFTKYKVLETTVTAQTAPNESGDATVNSDTPEVVITNPTQPVDVTISSGTSNPTIDVSAFMSVVGGETTGTLPAINITSENANNTNVEISASTVVTSSDATWDGVIAAPTITTVTLPPTSGETKTLSTAIEVGFSGEKLSFSKAVRILMPNQAGKRAGYTRDGGTTFTEITNTCSADDQATMNTELTADNECKMNASNGLDLVIWTKHFTTFATYTQTTNSTGSGNNGGGGGHPATSGTGSINGNIGTGTVGQVLGASTGPIDGCENRTTGFSIVTGESCLGNTGTILKFNFTKLMKKNSKGDEVIELQKFLNNLGHSCGTADGKFGPKTKACVIKFQLANKLKGDGIIGALTRAFLNK